MTDLFKSPRNPPKDNVANLFSKNSSPEGSDTPSEVRRSSRNIGKVTSVKELAKSSQKPQPDFGENAQPRRSLRTPAQTTSLKGAYAISKSLAVVLSPEDIVTPRSHIEAFLSVAETQPKPVNTATKTRQRAAAETSTSRTLRTPRPLSHASVQKKLPSVVEAAVTPGSKLTPRTNIWNLLHNARDQEHTPVMRTDDKSKLLSGKTRASTSVREEWGQEIILSPFYSSSETIEEAPSLSKKSPRRTRRSFHIPVPQEAVRSSEETVEQPFSAEMTNPDNLSDERQDRTRPDDRGSEREERTCPSDPNNEREEIVHSNNNGSEREERTPADDLRSERDDQEELDIDIIKADSRENKISSVRGETAEENDVGPEEDHSPEEEDVGNSFEEEDVGNSFEEEDVGNIFETPKEGDVLLSENTGNIHTAEERNVLLGENINTVEEGNVVLGGNMNTVEEGNILLGENINTVEEGNILLGGNINTVEEGNILLGGNMNTVEEGNVLQWEVVDFRNVSPEGGSILIGEIVEVGTDAYEEDRHAHEGRSINGNIYGILNGRSPIRESAGDNAGTPEKDRSTVLEKRDGRRALVPENIQENGGEAQDEARRDRSLGGNRTSITSKHGEISFNTYPKNSPRSTPVTETAKKSIYDLSEGSSSGGDEEIFSPISSSGSPRKGRQSGLSSTRRNRSTHTKGTSAGKSTRQVTNLEAASPSYRRSRLSYAEWKSLQGRKGPASQTKISSYFDLVPPHSSTPTDKTKRILHSTNMQNSYLDHTSQDLMSGARMIDPISGLSPIHPVSKKQQKTGTESGHEADTDANHAHGHDGDDFGNWTDLESYEEFPGLSPLATPHIDMGRKTQASSIREKSMQKQLAQIGTHGPERKKRKPEAAIDGEKQPAKRSRKSSSSATLPRRSVKFFAERHSNMKLSNDAIEEIEKVSEIFWEDTFKALEIYALHAGRKVINDEDVVLLMKTQRLITTTEDLYDRIREFLPMELRTELIPVAKPVF